jgi:hypothetical protein
LREPPGQELKAIRETHCRIITGPPPRASPVPLSFDLNGPLCVRAE